VCPYNVERFTLGLEYDPPFVGRLIVESGTDGESVPPRTVDDALACDEPRGFGFIDSDSYFYTRRPRQTDGGKAPIQLVVRMQGEDQVISDQLRYGVMRSGVFRRQRRLYFVATSMTSESDELWTVDLTVQPLTQERVPVEGPIRYEMLASTSNVPGSRCGYATYPYTPFRDNSSVIRDASEREALLLATKPKSPDPSCSHSDCGSRWWVADFDRGRVIELDSSWQHAHMTWTSDGQGVLAIHPDDGLFLILGSDYQTRFPLSHRVPVQLLVPAQWPDP
jgi:hypothetical protein